MPRRNEGSRGVMSGSMINSINDRMEKWLKKQWNQFKSIQSIVRTAPSLSCGESPPSPNSWTHPSCSRYQRPRIDIELWTLRVLDGLTLILSIPALGRALAGFCFASYTQYHHTAWPPVNHASQMMGAGGFFCCFRHVMMIR